MTNAKAKNQVISFFGYNCQLSTSSLSNKDSKVWEGLFMLLLIQASKQAKKKGGCCCCCFFVLRGGIINHELSVKSKIAT